MMLSTCTYSKVKTNTSSYKNKISIAYHVIFNIYHNNSVFCLCKCELCLRFYDIKNDRLLNYTHICTYGHMDPYYIEHYSGHIHIPCTMCT